jgi:predicted TIM-barrel fold metal-dependent hydrolase
MQNAHLSRICPSSLGVTDVDYLKHSADDHIDLGYLPQDLWQARVPATLKERAPRVEEREGNEVWVCDGEVWGDYRGERWFARPRRPTALDRGGVAEPHRPTTPAKRLADMDRDRVEASVMFPPIFAMQVDEPELRNATVRAYNDWAADFAIAAPGRFLPVAKLSPVDPIAATEELVRAAGLGFKQVNFLVNDVTAAMHLKAWDPFWDTAEETGVIISYHVGGSLQGATIRGMRERMSNADRRPSFDMGLGNGATAFFEPFVNLFTFGTLERHPNLKFVLGESGTGWIPFVVQEMDYRFNRALEARESLELQELPSEVFKRQVWATYQADFVGLHLLPFFGDGHVMWASDYPHPDSTWPYSQDVVERETAHLPAKDTRKIVRDNAAALYAL